MSPAYISIIILVISMILFFTEVFPVPFTAMGILVAFILTGVLEPIEAFSGLIDSSILLFTAMFIVGDALFITGIADRIGQLLIKYAKTERRALILMMLTIGIASAFLSNTGTTAIFIPIVIGIARYDGYSRSRLMMPVCLAATIGGSITLLGTPPNIVVNSVLVEAGHTGFSIFSFTPVALPLLLISVVYYAFIGYKFVPEKDSTELSGSDIAKYEKEMNHSEIPNWKRNVAMAVLVFTVAGMIFSESLGIPFYVIAWVGALILVYLKVISGAEALDAMDWSSVLLITGTLSIGTALAKTGAGSLIADGVLSIVGTNPTVVLSSIMLITVILSNFMSNTAAAALLAPIGLTIAVNMGSNPQQMIMAIAIASSFSYATPFGSTPNTMVYGLGGYKFSHYSKVGLPLMFINFIVAVILLEIFF